MVSNERLKIGDTFKSEVSSMKQFCSLIPLLRSFFFPTHEHFHDLENTKMERSKYFCNDLIQNWNGF